MPFQLTTASMRRLMRLCLGLGILLSTMTGCSTQATYNPPKMPLPAHYKYAAQDQAAPDGASAKKPSTLDAPIDWWHYFGNHELEGLIDRGLANNPDMRIALNHIVQAKARADQAAAGKLPSITANLVGADQAPGGVTVGTAPAGGTASRAAQATYQAGIRADWRLDIWGEQKALADSASYQLQKAVYERENVQRNLVASIASSYVEYLALNDRLKSALETDEILNATLSTIEKRVKAGDATLTELEQQRAAIFAARASVPSLEQQRLDLIGTLAFLVGTMPGNINLSEDGLDSLAVPHALAGLPSALLLRRPDVRVAEAQLLAADADLAVARARLLPPMDLSAQAGYSSIALTRLFQPGAMFWNVVDSVTVTIFDRGRKKNDQIFSQSVQEEMVETYARTIFQAMKEVESALSSVHQATRRLSDEQQSVQAAHLAWDISTRVYTMGGVDYLTLLDTQRSYHNYLESYQQTRMEYLKSYISLFQSLGGGVAPEHPKSEMAAPAPRTTPLPPVEGIALNEGSDTSPDTFWQVELAGLYHRSAIGPAWRDLLNRYPRYMMGRVVRPRLKGGVDEHSQQSWHRLYVAKFSNPGQAEQFCLALQADQQRCRVVSSQSDATIDPAAIPALMAAIIAGPRPGANATYHAPPASLPPPARRITPPQPAAAIQVISAQPVAAPISRSLPVKPASATSQATPSQAASKLDLTPAHALTAPPAQTIQSYTIQLGAYAIKENAVRVTSVLLSRRMPAYVAAIRQNPTLFAVRMGTYDSKAAGQAAIRSLSPHERKEARLVIASIYEGGGKPPISPP